MIVSPFVALPPVISPLPARAKPAVVVRQVNSAPFGWQILTGRDGDNLSDIAIAHRSTVGALIARNLLKDGGGFLSIGQHLWVPRTSASVAPTTAVEARTATHDVRAGDTLDGMATRYRASRSTLSSLHRISPAE